MKPRSPSSSPNKQFFFTKFGAKISLVSLLLASTSTIALANCVTTGNTTICDTAAPNPYTSTIGTGPGVANDNKTVIVDTGAQITVGNVSAISLQDNASITVNGAVQNTATSSGGNYPGPGGFNTI